MSPSLSFRRFAGFLLLLARSLGGAARAQYPDDNLYAPSFSLRTPTGASVRYPEVADGQPSVLMFWPAWCPYSHALLPYLQDIQDDYRAAGLRVWLVSVRRDGEHDPVRILRELRSNLGLLLDGDAVMPSYRVEYTPWLIVVDGERNTRYTRPPRPDSPVQTAQEIRRMLNELLGPRAVAMPTHYPSPESRGWRPDLVAASPVSPVADPRRQPPVPLPEVLWASWLESYLAGVGADEYRPEFGARGPVGDGKKAIAIARELWTQRYGAAAVEREAPYRAYRQDDLWVVLGAPPQRALGEGMVLVIEQDSGRVRRLLNKAAH